MCKGNRNSYVVKHNHSYFFLSFFLPFLIKGELTTPKTINQPSSYSHVQSTGDDSLTNLSLLIILFPPSVQIL